MLALIGLAAFGIRLVPVLTHGGLRGLLGYDDGVYFGAAVALLEGRLPYRDILLLHPPGIVLLLTPFAALGGPLGDDTAFAIARVGSMALGALNAVLVARIAGRWDRLAGIIAGLLFAAWSTASSVERSTDLHAFENLFLLLGLLVLGRPGRARVAAAGLGGAALGLATAVHLWQGVAVAVAMWWLVVRGRGTGVARLAPAFACGAAAVGAFALVCLPSLLTAPAQLVGYAFLDQISRPQEAVPIVDRVRVLEGLVRLSQLPSVVRPLASTPIVLAAALAAAAFLAATAWKRVWTRPWAVLAATQALVVLATPSFYNDYPGLVGPAVTLVGGTGLAAVLHALRPARRTAGRVVVGLGVLVLAIVSLARANGEPLPVEALRADVERATGCISADNPELLVLSGGLRRDLALGCPILLDPTGVRYETDRGTLAPGGSRASMIGATGYQGAMLDWYGDSELVLFVTDGAGLSGQTLRDIRARHPISHREGPVTVLAGAAALRR